MIETMTATLARTTMVPPDDLLPDVLPTERLNARAMPTRPLHQGCAATHSTLSAP